MAQRHPPPITKETSNHVAWSETKDGEVVEIRYAEDISGPNRGFIDNETSVWINDEKVGYLTSTYVPMEKYVEYNPTIWNFANNFSGWCLGISSFLLDSTDSINPFTFDQDRFNSFAKTTLHYLGVGDFSLSDKVFTQEEFEAIAKKSRKYKDLVKEEKKFKDFQIDSPYVGYISTRENEHRGVLSNNQGRGLGVLLYIATAKIYDEKGLQFRSSSLQQPRAKRIWEKFEELGWAIPVRERLVMQPKQLPSLDGINEVFRKPGLNR